MASLVPSEEQEKFFSSVLLFPHVKTNVGPSSTVSVCILAPWSKLIPTIVPVIIILAPMLPSILVSVLVLLLVLVVLLMLLVIIAALFWGRPALVGFLILIPRIKAVIRREGAIEVVIVALIGAGMCLLFTHV